MSDDLGPHVDKPAFDYSTLHYDEPDFFFDVSSEVSLDALYKELRGLVDNHYTKILVDLWGPGGGNFEVRVYTNSKTDLLAMKKWAEDNHCKPF